MGKNQSRSSWVRWLLVGAVCVSTVLSPLALPARPAHAQPPQEVLTTALQQVREQLSQLLGVYQSADAEAKAAIDAACLPLWSGRNYILVKPYVDGYDLNPMGYAMLNEVSVDRD